MNDGTNPKQQKASAVQDHHRTGCAVIERSACSAPEGLEGINDEEVVPSEL
jgi:hypothetical protein